MKEYRNKSIIDFVMENPIRNMSIIHVKTFQNDIVFKMSLSSDLFIVVVVVVLKKS